MRPSSKRRTAVPVTGWPAVFSRRVVVMPGWKPNPMGKAWSRPEDGVGFGQAVLAADRGVDLGERVVTRCEVVGVCVGVATGEGGGDHGE
jgi:hypothetical protein